MAHARVPRAPGARGGILEPYRLIVHEGIRILRVDYRGLTPAEHVAALKRVRTFLSAQPPPPLLVLTLANERFTAESTSVIRDYIRSVAPLVRANAIVAPGGFQSAFLLLAWTRVHRSVAAFEDEPRALAWLEKLARRHR